MENIAKAFLCCAFICFCFALNAQTTEDLEVRRKNILKQIDVANSILEETEKSQQTTLGEFLNLEKKITTRSSLIETIQHEILSNQDDISQGRDLILALNREIESLQKDYAVILRSAFRLRVTSNSMLYILSSQSLKQAFLKWRYMTQFENYATGKAQLIKIKLSQIRETIENIEKGQVSKEFLLKDEQIQQDLLKKELDNKNSLLSSLERDRDKLMQELDQYNRDRQELNQAISGIVMEESEDLVALDREESGINEGEIVANSNAPENFAEFKSSLPWPVEKGFISSKFGRRKHPALPQIDIVNNGVDIRSELMADVLAVFEGEVSGMASIPGFNHMLVLKHGEFRTVYARLGEITVNKGDMVKKGQIIGKLATEGQKSELHFEIWRGENKLDPEAWLTNK